MRSIINLRSLVLCFLILSAPLAAKQCYGSLTVSKLEGVHDGDTFKVTIDGIHPLIGKEILVRIAGIDTPELTSEDPKVQELACRARDHTEDLLRKAHKIVLKDVRRDKYFRILADVYVDGVHLGDHLLKTGLAKPYDGKTKPKW
jgi:micrococcal nuclease